MAMTAPQTNNGTASVMTDAPSVAVSMFYQAAGHAYSLSMQNATSAQQNINTLAPSVIANALALLNK